MPCPGFAGIKGNTRKKMKPIRILLRGVRWALIAALGLALNGIATIHAQGLTLTAITVASQPAQSIAGVQVRAPGASSSQPQTFTAGQAITAGAEITVPRDARIELTSSNGNKITLHGGARFVAGTVTSQGESHQPLGGRIDFQVRKALDFFNIQYERITAAVKGTEYSVEIDPGQTFTLAVTEGAVEVEREVQIRITDESGAVAAELEDSENAQGSGIRIAEVLRAGQRKRYQLDVEEYLAEFKNYGEAEAYFRKALSEAEGSKDRHGTLRSVLNLMELNWKAGKLAATPELEAKCVALAQALADAAGEAACLRLAGFAYHILGDLRKAIGYFEKSLAMIKGFHAQPDHKIIAANLYNLALSYGTLGEYRKALDYGGQALAMGERLAAGRDRQFVAVSYNHVGRSHGALGDQSKAIDYYQKALAMSERLNAGRDHPAIAMSFNHLGIAYAALGEHRRAVESHEKALAMRERLYAGRDHHHTATSYNNIGSASFMLGDYRKAIEYAEKGLAMRERLFAGRDHWFIGASLHILGRTYDAMGDYRKAIEYFEKGLAIRQRVYAADHLEIAASLINLGRSTRLAGDPRKAIEYHEKALAMRERLYPGRDHESVAQALGGLAAANAAAGNKVEARRYRERATAMNSRLKSQ